MTAVSVAEAIFAVQEEFDVRVADTPSLVRQAYELRHQVYCVERGYLGGSAGLEVDEFDERSEHVVLVSRDSDEVIGTVRLVLGSPERPEDSFPMQRVCRPGTLSQLPIETTAEVSRFAISKTRRSGTAAPLMRLGLVQGLVRLSGDLGITHWCAVMERSLLRLLLSSSIQFRPLGPVVDYHGPRQPCFNSLTRLLDRVAIERPEVWSFLTGSQLAPVKTASADARSMAA